MKKIEIYTTNYCPFCIKAKSLLKKKNINFSEIDVSNDEELREKMTIMANGARSVPQIFADNTHIGDCDKIHKLEKEKKLSKLLGLE
jgi:glutaredoxin 3